MIRGIIYDFVRTLYDLEKGQLFDGVLAMLNSFRDLGLKQGLVSFGGEEKEKLIQGLGLGGILDWYRVVEEKTPEVFRSFGEHFNLPAGQVLVVGDLVNEEVAVGRRLGMATVWLKAGKFSEAAAGAAPDFTIAAINDLEPIVTDLAQFRRDRD